MKLNTKQKTLVAIAISLIVLVDPFKVTDPLNPAFNPDRFSFRDYSGREELMVVYRALFPIGTPKAEVDRVLMKAGGATCYNAPEIKSLWLCRQPKSLKHWDHAPVFSIAFDDDLKLLNIYPNNTMGVYPNGVKLEDILKIKVEN